MNKMLLRKSIRDLRAAWTQSVALIVIVALGIASFIALVSSYRDLSGSYDRTYETLRFADVTFRVAAAPEAAAADLRAVAGVAAVTPRLIRDGGYQLPDGEPIRARLIGLPGLEQPAVNRLVVEEGVYFGAASILLESHFATLYDIHPGDFVTPIVNGETVRLEVAGIATSPEYLFVSPSQQDLLPSARTFAVLWLPLATVQALTERPGLVNDFAVLFSPGADVDQVSREIQTLLAPYQLETTVLQANQPSNALLRQDVAGYKEIANLMPAIILLVAALSVYALLGRMVRAQQPQIGLMKALGYSTGDVAGHYLFFALVIGAAGLLLGLSGGVPLARWITATYARELLIPFIETQFYPDVVAASVAISLVLCLLAGLGPARSAARLAPAEAMREDPALAAVTGKRSRLEALLRLPLEARLPLRNVLRLRRRSLTTGLGIVFAFVLVLMVWAMFDSMDVLLDEKFNDAERWDLVAAFDQPQGAATLATIEGWAGVVGVEPLIQFPVTLRSGAARSDVMLTALDPAQEMHMLQLARGLTPAQVLGNNQVVVAQALADDLGLAVGDALTLETPFGALSATVGAATQELVNTAVYMSSADVRAAAALPPGLFNGLYLQAEPDAVGNLKAELYRLPGAASVARKSDLYNDLLQMLNLFYTFMGVMLLFALGMAFALLFNATTINVLERQRELATMRAIGTSGRQIAGQISAENIILWLLSLAPGLLLGYLVALQLGDAFSSELFAFDVIISPRSFALTSVGILVTMLLAAWPAIRRVNRLNLAEATKVLV